MNFMRIYESHLQELIDDFDGKERQAWKYAKRKHDDTGAIRRASKSPYFVHPEGVAKILKQAGASSLEVIAGLAHDLIEDAGAVPSDLAEKFGSKVADIVSEVTNDDNEIAKTDKETYMNRKMLGLSNEALTVKLGDVLNNTRDAPGPKQKARMLANVNYVIDNRDLTQIQLNLVDQIFAVD